MSQQPNKPTLQARCTAARAGVTKYFGSAASVTLRGKAWKPADIDTALGAAIADGNTTDTAKAAWQSAVATGKASRVVALAILAALKALVLATYGDDPKVLGDFAFEPPKPHKVPAATKAAAVVKTKATKQQLGPTGKVQRKKAAKSGAATPAATTPEAPAPSPAAPPATKS